MVDPLSIACLTALAEVTKAVTKSLTTESIMTSTTSGIFGNRADFLFCKLIQGSANLFVKNAQIPENHDLINGMVEAYQRSINYVAETISGQARNIHDRMIANAIVAAAKNERCADASVVVSVMPLLTPLIAGPGEDESGLRSERMIAVARDGLIAWFENEIGETLPDHFRCLFAEPAPNGRSPWQDVFRLYLAEAVKTDPRFERNFLASNVAEIVGRTITIETLVIGLENGLGSLGQQLGIVSIDIKRILATQEALLKRFVETPLAAQAREANVEQRAFVELARRINLEVDNEEQALKELNQAVEKLLKDKANAEHDWTLHRIAEQSRRGEFDSAASEAASAFVNWELREAARRDTARQSGLTLIEANIGQHLLRRDSVAAAEWIERRIILEGNGKPADATSLMREIQNWYDRGCERGLNLDLSVAIALSRRAVVLSLADSVGAAQQWLGLALTVLGERESGTARLEDAVGIFREILQERNRACVPLDWAAAQSNLGLAQTILGEREPGTARLEEAVGAFREALEERTRACVPLQWKQTQKNIAEAEQAIDRKKRRV